ncbi:MAG: agmatinase family protein [Planctomycetes bacterium]|nr:agmatinase family protein [Planctomycetota bacterium]
MGAQAGEEAFSSKEPRVDEAFDPNGPARHDGLFGLPHTLTNAAFVVVPVPFDATTSGLDGTRDGPRAVLEASYQVDLYDADFGNPWERGIFMFPLDRGPVPQISAWNQEARRHARVVLDAPAGGGARRARERALNRANRLCGDMNTLVEGTVRALLAQGRTAVVLGGDHSTPFGAIAAYADRHPGLGLLHVDAHADLRSAYEGFTWSHASIMRNVVTRLGGPRGVSTLVQVGVRDFCTEELTEIRRRKARSETRIVTHFDTDLAAAKMRGRAWGALARAIVRPLPRVVYVSVDIDGLDPKLCPDTGTPVPGGLEFAELVELLRALVRSGRRIVGFDLNEVAPKRGTRAETWGGDWNGNVGARVLYKLIGAAAASGDSPGPGKR